VFLQLTCVLIHYNVYNFGPHQITVLNPMCHMKALQTDPNMSKHYYVCKRSNTYYWAISWSH